MFLDINQTRHYDEIVSLAGAILALEGQFRSSEVGFCGSDMNN